MTHRVTISQSVPWTGLDWTRRPLLLVCSHFYSLHRDTVRRKELRSVTTSQAQERTACCIIWEEWSPASSQSVQRCGIFMRPVCLWIRCNKCDITGRPRAPHGWTGGGGVGGGYSGSTVIWVTASSRTSAHFLFTPEHKQLLWLTAPPAKNKSWR